MTESALKVEFDGELRRQLAVHPDLIEPREARWVVDGATVVKITSDHVNNGPITLPEIRVMESDEGLTVLYQDKAGVGQIVSLAEISQCELAVRAYLAGVLE